MSETSEETVCPKCDSTRVRRKERKLWTRAIPGSGHFSCNDCNHKFVARLSTDAAEKAGNVAEPKPVAAKAAKVAATKSASPAPAAQSKKGKPDTESKAQAQAGDASIDELLSDLDTRIAALRERAEATAKHLDSLRQELDAPAGRADQKAPVAKPATAKKSSAAKSDDAAKDTAAGSDPGETWTPGAGSSKGRSKKKARGRRRKA